MKLLNKYITYKMALDLMGAKQNQTTRIYRIIDGAEIEVISIGNMRLINRAQFCKASDIDGGDLLNKVRWPVHLAVMGVEEIIDAEEASEILGLSVRQVYNLAKSGTLIMYDLKPWGGQNVLYKASVTAEKSRRDLMSEMRKRKKTAKGSRATRN